MDWVISIAGGGTRNLYTAGILEALRDLGVTFKAASGTSSGSWCSYNAIRPNAHGSKKLCCAGKAVTQIYRQRKIRKRTVFYKNQAISFRITFPTPQQSTQIKKKKLDAFGSKLNESQFISKRKFNIL